MRNGGGDACVFACIFLTYSSKEPSKSQTSVWWGAVSASVRGNTTIPPAVGFLFFKASASALRTRRRRRFLWLALLRVFFETTTATLSVSFSKKETEPHEKVCLRTGRLFGKSELEKRVDLLSTPTSIANARKMWTRRAVPTIQEQEPAGGGF